MSQLWDDPSPSSFCTFWQRVYCVALPVVLLVVPAFWLLHNKVHAGQLLGTPAFVSRVVLLPVRCPRSSYSSISFFVLYLLTKWWCTTRLPRHHHWWWFSTISLVVTPSLDHNMLDAFDTPLSTRPYRSYWTGKKTTPRIRRQGHHRKRAIYHLFLGQRPIITLRRGAPTFLEGWNVL